MFKFEDMYAEPQDDGSFLISSALTKKRLFVISRVPGEGPEYAASYAAALSFFAPMRRALLDARRTLEMAYTGVAAKPKLLGAMAYADSPLNAISRIESWAKPEPRQERMRAHG